MQKDLILTLDAVPEKHNLSFYPTINEIYNHIHQTLQDIGCARSLPFRDSEITENNKHVVCYIALSRYLIKDRKCFFVFVDILLSDVS